MPRQESHQGYSFPMATQKKIKQKRNGKPLEIVSIVALILCIAVGTASFILFFEGEKPTIKLVHPAEYIGKTDTIDIEAADGKSGLRQVDVVLRQGEIQKELFTKAYPRTRYTGQIGPLSEKLALPFDAAALGFKDGDIALTITVRDFSMRGFFNGNRSTVQQNLKLDTQPPKITLLHSEQYISPGGSGIAIYRLSDSEGKHGVVVNGHFNAGHPLGDGKEGINIAYFALPYDTAKIEQSTIEAADVAGNKVSVPFSTIFKPVHFKHDKITISDSFLTSKVPEFEQYNPEMKGTPLEKYLYANQKLRIANNEKISQLCATTESKRLWQGAFHRFLGSSEAGFADHRTYYYNGEAIDEQTHLGMDIASTAHAEVRAANSGKVVYADYLGIYGNMVMLDHGQGVFTLYSHLSQINVKPGSTVDQKTVLGLSGTTGMAGGDHLHFSVLINGVFVTPIEWWDPHWIEVTIDGPLKSAK
jgi:hypothetical protein